MVSGPGVVLELSLSEFFIPLAIVILVTYVIGVWLFYYILKGEEDQFWPLRVLDHVERFAGKSRSITTASNALTAVLSIQSDHRISATYRAVCSCGWHGESRSAEQNARFDALDHLRTLSETDHDQRNHRWEIQTEAEK